MQLHSIVHVELAAEDPAQLGEFYTRVFGWQVHPMAPDGSYLLWSVGEGENQSGGGFRRFMDGENREPSARIMFHIHVADIEAKLAEVEASGGSRMIPRTEIEGGHGFYAVFSDPAGNTVGMWSKEG
jgi:predicted enzyme related to lactoylglutathione lyase